MTDADEVRRVVAATLNLPIERIAADASAETVPEWDSVNHVSLLMAIEEEFGVQLEVEDFATLVSVPAIVAHLAARRG